MWFHGGLASPVGFSTAIPGAILSRLYQFTSDGAGYNQARKVGLRSNSFPNAQITALFSLAIIIFPCYTSNTSIRWYLAVSSILLQSCVFWVSTRWLGVGESFC
jgi:hypothetical protein